MVGSLNELLPSEQDCLRRLARGSDAFITSEVSARLLDLGLAKRAIGGIEITEFAIRLIMEADRPLK